MHALSCAAKSLIGFVCRDGIQECREACGGHGYLSGTVLMCISYINRDGCLKIIIIHAH